MSDIVIVAQYSMAPGEGDDHRYDFLARQLVAAGHRVELVTSDFSHDRKAHRRLSAADARSVTYTYTMLPEPGYTANVSLWRIFSHRALARRVRAYLQKRQAPDAIFCAVPSLAVAGAVARCAKARGVRLVIDVQDLWPQAFCTVLPCRAVTSRLMAPLAEKAKRIYAAADAVAAVSETYRDIALQAGDGARPAAAVYIGRDLARFDAIAADGTAADFSAADIWLVYSGTLGYSYDLKPVIDAVRLLPKEKRIALLVMGDGPQMKKWQAYAVAAPVVFTGRLPYEQAVANLKRCHIALDPINAAAVQSVVNKHGDYAAAGLPVISTRRAGEHNDLLGRYRAGICVTSGRAEDVAAAILAMADDPVRRENMGAQSRRMAEELFDRRVTYPRLAKLIAKGEHDS